MRRNFWKIFGKKRTPRKVSFSTLIFFSVLLHLFFYKSLLFFGNPKPPKKEKDVIKLKILSKKIIETHFDKTEKPKEAKYLGQTDHLAKKEKKLRKNLHRKSKALDPGKNKKRTLPSRKPQASLQIQKSEKKKIPQKGLSSVKKQMSSYEKLLNKSRVLISSATKEQFEDHVKEDLEEGDTVDLSTTQFRYISYFTNLRKQIELTWVYPSFAARTGKQGNVLLEFTIAKNGAVSGVKVLESSGYRILDDSIVEAVNDASPFAPLPESLKKEKLRITGNFTYVISGFSSY